MEWEAFVQVSNRERAKRGTHTEGLCKAEAVIQGLAE